MSQALVEIHNLEFSYGSKPVLRIPAWRLHKQERVFLEGPSGSGKTTFLEILSGFLQVQKGSYLFQGQDLSKASEAVRDDLRRRSIGFIFQNFNLIPYLNVEDNVLLPFSLGHKDSRSVSELRRELSDLLAQLGLKDFEKRSVLELSQGQQQRVAAARAFLKRPTLLLADEPTSALDQDHRESFLRALFQLADQNSTALIFVSHDRTLETLFHRTCHMRDWRVR